MYHDYMPYKTSLHYCIIDAFSPILCVLFLAFLKAHKTTKDTSQGYYARVCKGMVCNVNCVC